MKKSLNLSKKKVFMNKNICFHRDFIDGFPDKSKVCSPLSNKHISDDDYDLVAKVGKRLKWKIWNHIAICI